MKHPLRYERGAMPISEATKSYYSSLDSHDECLKGEKMAGGGWVLVCLCLKFKCLVIMCSDSVFVERLLLIKYIRFRFCCLFGFRIVSVCLGYD